MNFPKNKYIRLLIFLAIIISGCRGTVNIAETGIYAVNDIWKLERINGEAINIPESRRHPTLEVNLAENSISGYGGCNNFHGNVQLVDNKIVTAIITSTKMACLDIQDIENLFLTTLTGNILDFSIDGPNLKLWDNKIELMFTRIRKERD